MSKKDPAKETPKEPTVRKLPLADCIGKTVKCPSCGKSADVSPARGAMLRQQPISSKFWVMLKCKGCGSRLERIAAVVDVEAESLPPPVKRPVGEVVSHFIKCPTPDCGMQAKAAWTIEDGHVIDCPQCQRRRVSPETEVEIIA
jgi:hypothetical protein